MQPISLKSLLQDALKRGGIKQPVKRAMIVDAANRALDVILPAGHAMDARAYAHADRAILVSCLHSSAASLVRSRSSSILDAIKKSVPDADVLRVHVSIRDRHPDAKVGEEIVL